MKRVLLTIVLLTGCMSAYAEELTTEHIINSLNAAGLEGERNEAFYGMIGAIDGFKYNSTAFDVEFYKFKTEEGAEDCQICEFTNGKWGMFIHKGERPAETWEAAVKIFKEL